MAAEKAEAIRVATAEPSERVRERLEKASEADVIDDIFRNFTARAERERAARAAADASAKAEAEATAMLDALNSTARNRWGKDWAQTRTYDFDRYMQAVRERMRNDTVLDPDNSRHTAAMSRLLSTRLVHGANSEEYRRQLADFEEYRRTVQGTIASAPQDTPAPQLQDTAGHDGRYSGSFSGGASGTIQFQVSGSRISGRLSGAHKGDGFIATFSGGLTSDGSFAAAASGDFTSGESGYAFTGRVSGRLASGSGSGSWSGKNSWSGAEGAWRAQR